MVHIVRGINLTPSQTRTPFQPFYSLYSPQNTILQNLRCYASEDIGLVPISSIVFLGIF